MFSHKGKCVLYLIALPIEMAVFNPYPKSINRNLLFLNEGSFLAARSHAAMVWPDFQDVKGIKHSKNILVNSSFEITTNSDIPDGWSRDYSLPAWGYEAYFIDDKYSFHGAKTVRLGCKRKYVKSWYRK